MLPKRPDKLPGTTYLKDTPEGKLHLTVTWDESGNPIETFLNLGKRGRHSYAMGEAIGRLISCLLRLEELGTREERAQLIIDQLEGIGGGDPQGYGPERICSVPDAVARCLRESMERSETVVLGAESVGGSQT
jgi:ribonucleoside-diphosphate reductase alpha chain